MRMKFEGRAARVDAKHGAWCRKTFRMIFSAVRYRALLNAAVVPRNHLCTQSRSACDFHLKNWWRAQWCRASLRPAII